MLLTAGGRFVIQVQFRGHPMAATVAGCAQTTQIVPNAESPRAKTPAPNAKNAISRLRGFENSFGVVVTVISAVSSLF